MNHSPNANIKTKEMLTSVCAALALGAVVFVTQIDSISALASNFQGGSPTVSQAPDMTSIRILFPA